MKLARRDWLRCAAGALVSGTIWAEANSPTVGEDIRELVRQWNRFPPPRNFRRGTAVLGRSHRQVTRTDKGWETVINGGQAIATPLVVNGRVYVGTGFGGHDFYCLNAETGQVIWTARLSDNGPTAAAYEDGIVYVNTESCTLFALNANTGQQIWSWWLGDPLPTMPTVANGKVFTAYPAGAPDGQERRVLACLNARTGQVHWLRWIDSEILSCPVADKQDVYVATFGGILYRFQQADGALLLAVRSWPTSAPVVMDDYLVYSRVRQGTNVETVIGHSKSDNRLLLESAARSARNWPQDSGANAAYVYQGSRPVFWDGKIIVNLGEAVHCLGAVHGMPYWSKKVGEALPPVVVGDTTVVATQRGEIVLLNSRTGDVITKHDLHAPITFPPVVDHGNIYAVTAQGKLVCIKTGDDRLTGWSCWGKHAHRNSVA